MPPSPVTEKAAAEISLAPGINVVQVWRIPVGAHPAPAGELNRWLTPEEQARGGRFSRAEDRIRFELGRAATRCVLARYLGMAPQDVGIDPDPAGKPHLTASTATGKRMIHFNLSHSGGWILAAFARSFAVGIDVEVVRAKSVSADLIAYVMSASEIRILRTLPEQQQNAAFFKCWTSKEAFVKGVGVGLAVPLQAIEVSIAPDEPAQLLAAPPELRPGDWRLLTLGFSEPYAATLAVAAPSAQVIENVVTNWRDIDGASSAG
jgi:4'-phosphopantetheinyl transferase